MVLSRPPVIFAFIVVWAILALSLATQAQTKSRPDCSFSSQSGNIQEGYRSGVAALQRSDLATARRHFELLVKQAPNCAELHDLFGYAMLRQAESKKAIQEFETATRLKSGF